MDKIDKLNYLGWGIVASAKGRQSSSAGVDKQIQQAKLFDLEQNIGACLPDPIKDQAQSTLYYFTYREFNNGNLMGIAEYRSVRESGQSRSGTYFGSFIEIINSIPTANDEVIKQLFSALFDLNLYQYNNFIDKQTFSYQQSINGIDFDAPRQQLNKIAENLTALPAKTIHFNFQTKQDLFIYVENKTLLIQVLQCLINQQLYLQYKNIYFSMSREIAEKIHQRKKLFL